MSKTLQEMKNEFAMDSELTYEENQAAKVDHKSFNIGTSDYAKHKIQPWDIWLEYQLNPWDADIIKRVLRDSGRGDRKLDYQKIIHVCQERISQLKR